MNDTTLHSSLSVSTYATGLLACAEQAIRGAEDTLARYNRLRATVPWRALATISGAYDDRHPAIVAVDRWRAHTTGTFVLTGPVGTGKTVAAAHYAWKARASWLSAVEVASMAFGQWDDAFRTLRDVSRAVIDDVAGLGASGPVALERVAALIKLRHENGQQTVITTNQDEDGLARSFEGVASVDSRFADCVRGDGEWFATSGASMRRGQSGHAARLQAALALVRQAALVRTLTDGDETAEALHAAEALQERLQIATPQVEDMARKLADDNARLHSKFLEAAKRFRPMACDDGMH